jgi:hypothetical protein
MKKINVVATIIAFIASTTAVGISPVAAEGQNQVSAHIDWAGINMTPNTALSQTITPLNVPSTSVGNVDWGIHMGNTEQAIWPNFQLSNSGIALFAFYDVPAGSKVENVGKSNCNLNSPNAFQKANTWRSTCSAPLMPIAGESYEFAVKPLKINGSLWWAGSVTIQSTGEVIQLGRLENNLSQTVINGSQSMSGMDQITFWKETLPPCSKIPDFSAIYGPVLTTTGSAAKVSGTRISETCPGLSGIDTFSNPGSYRVNIGNKSGTQDADPKPIVNSSGSANTEAPSFSLVSFSGSKVNINVNLGSNNQPDKIYLVSPDLGITEAKKVLGKISGSVATWSVSFSSLLSGKSIPLKLISMKNGIETNVLEEIFNVPGAIKNAITGSVPEAPKNITSRVIGTSGIVTAVTTLKAGSLAQSAYLFGSALGVTSVKPIKGEILATKVIFEIPIEASMAGKTFPFTVYYENDAGKSAPAAGKISIPSIPKITIDAPKFPTSPGASNTVFCLKGSISRTFAAKSCPPGWKKS